MDVAIKIHSDPEHHSQVWTDLEHCYAVSPTMTIETLDEGKVDTIKITIQDKDIYVDWHDLADAVDMLGRVLGKGQGCIDREERL